MSTVVLLKQAIEAAKAQYPAGLTEDEIFELFCADSLLKKYDLTYDEIGDGVVDGHKDGGIDAVYAFVNRQLLDEDTDLSVFKSPVEIEVIIIQSKHQESFKEAAVDRLSSSLPMLLNLSTPPETLSATFNEAVTNAFLRYRDALGKLGLQMPSIAIQIHYCSKGDAPNDAVMHKAQALAAGLKTSLGCPVEFGFYGAEGLYKLAQTQRTHVGELPVTGTPLFGNNSFVVLCKLNEYARFISGNGGGSLMTRLFEANVRAYQGDVEVNREIADSLRNPAAGLDFWWLNNGVTIVADDASYMNGQMVIKNPLIVNGLQTSYELHRFSREREDPDRQILIRIIKETDPIRRDQIIKATNRQTSIGASSLRATEPIHRRIEDYLKAHGLFYDRRKNHYKNENKPADRIIGIDKMAQAAMTVLLNRPHDARARPTTLIKSDADYTSIFKEDDATHPLELYRVAAELLLKIEIYFKTATPKLDRRYTNNLKFHTLMVVVWNAGGANALPAAAIAKIKPQDVTTEQVMNAANWVMKEFDTMGGDDRTAKDKAFTDHLIATWTKPKKVAPPVSTDSAAGTA